MCMNLIFNEFYSALVKKASCVFGIELSKKWCDMNLVLFLFIGIRYGGICAYDRLIYVAKLFDAELFA